MGLIPLNESESMAFKFITEKELIIWESDCIMLAMCAKIEEVEGGCTDDCSSYVLHTVLTARCHGRAGS